MNGENKNMQKQYEYGEVFRILRIANDMTIKKLAELAGLSSAYVCGVMLSKKTPSFKTTEKLLNIMGFSLYDFTIVAEYRYSLGNDVSELHKYQLTLLKTLKILVEKSSLNEETAQVL